MLSKGFNLAMRAGSLTAPPYVPKLAESSPRSGFLERGDLEKIIAHLPACMVPPVRFAFVSGWRIRSEVVKITWDRVDLEQRTVRLEPGTTKNRQGRLIVLTKDLLRLLKGQARRRHEGVRWVFPGADGVKAIPGATAAWYWSAARAKAGLPDALLHDMRRGAVRELDRAGVPLTIAMRITGHKTRAIFDRYNIGDERDIRAAAAMLDRPRTGTASGTVVRRRRWKTPKNP